MEYSPPGSSVSGILQARILEWVAIPFSIGFSQPRDWTRVSHTAGRFFTIWATRKAQSDAFNNIRYITLLLKTFWWLPISIPIKTQHLWDTYKVLPMYSTCCGVTDPLGLYSSNLAVLHLFKNMKLSHQGCTLWRYASSLPATWLAAAQILAQVLLHYHQAAGDSNVTAQRWEREDISNVL